jgi:hypothetical protein
MKIKLLLLVSTVFFICGCNTTCNECSDQSGIIKTNGTHTKIALICSLTKVDKKYYDGWDGYCPGTDIDAKNFAMMCSRNNIPYIKIENEQCTGENVVNLWKSCVNSLDTNNGLFIFFYSGHGGQVYSSTEKDGLDETLCLWDGQMRDDVVWQLLNLVPKTCRTFMVTDCCNSGTNFQLPFNFGKDMSSRNKQPNMLHYGGCGDSESSYGSSIGGVFTNYLKKNYNKKYSYIEWFTITIEQMKGQKQKPTFAETGISFKNTKIFE